MAISTYKVFLMLLEDSSSTTTTYSKLIDIKDYPDLGGAPEMLETTTLSDGYQTYIPGIQSNEALEFTANYTVSEYKALQAMEGTEYNFAVWFGGDENADGTVDPSGDCGKFSFSGELSVFVVGGSTNEVVDMTITIAPSSAITFSAS